MREIVLNTDRLLITNPKADIKDKAFQFIYSQYCDIENNKYALGNTFVTKKQLMTSFKEEIINNYFYCVASLKTDFNYLGFLKGFFAPKHRNIFWLKVFLIENNYRRKNYGTEFYEAIELHLKTFFGIKIIFVSVHENNSHALIFWDKQGFVQYDDVCNFNGQSKNQQKIKILKKILKMT